MRLADISPAEEAYAFPSQVHDDDVLIGVRLSSSHCSGGPVFQGFSASVDAVRCRR